MLLKSPEIKETQQLPLLELPNIPQMGYGKYTLFTVGKVTMECHKFCTPKFTVSLACVRRKKKSSVAFLLAFKNLFLPLFP